MNREVVRFRVRDGRVVKMRYVWHEFTPWSTLYPDCTGADFIREWQVFEEYVGGGAYGDTGERFLARRSDPTPPSDGYGTLIEALNACAEFWNARLDRATASMQEASSRLVQVRQQIQTLKAEAPT